jgi:hypothetical protein
MVNYLIHHCAVSRVYTMQMARASQVAGMRAQTFHAGPIMEVATRFKVQPDEVFITCMKRLRSDVFTRECQLRLHRVHAAVRINNKPTCFLGSGNYR